MAKAEISWKRTDEFGEKIQVYAHRTGGRWLFYSRHRRFDRWEPMKHPPLEDWLELLDAMRRLVPRRRHPPQELEAVERAIREHYPEAEIPPEKV